MHFFSLYIFFFSIVAANELKVLSIIKLVTIFLANGLSFETSKIMIKVAIKKNKKELQLSSLLIQKMKPSVELI